MRIPFSLLFLLLLLAEIAGFILVGEAIGVLATLGLVLLGMVAGVMLLRWQGMATLGRVRAELEAGRTPGRPLAEGAALAVGALLIMVPGFITDLLGALLYLPPLRQVLWRAAEQRVKVRTASAPGRPPHGSDARRHGPVIDLDSSDYGASPRADSPWRQDGRQS